MKIEMNGNGKFRLTRRSWCGIKEYWHRHDWFSWHKDAAEFDSLEEVLHVINQQTWRRVEVKV